jgi:hypothetical protein
MLFVEEEAILSVEDPRSGGAADEIPERVAADGRQGKNRGQGLYI